MKQSLRVHALFSVCATLCAMGCDGEETTGTNGTSGGIGGTSANQTNRGGSSSGFGVGGSANRGGTTSLGVGGGNRGGTTSLGVGGGNRGGTTSLGVGGTSVTAAGGAFTGTSLADACARNCVTLLSLACAATPYSSQTECQSDCIAGASEVPACTPPYLDWLICLADRPSSDWYCDDVEGAQYGGDACMDLAMSVVTCTVGDA